MTIELNMILVMSVSGHGTGHDADFPPSFCSTHSPLSCRLTQKIFCAIFQSFTGRLNILRYCFVISYIVQNPAADTRLFHRTTFCWEDTPTGKNLVPPINTRSTVVELVKLMAWRQAKSLMNIPPSLLVVRKFVKMTFAH